MDEERLKLYLTHREIRMLISAAHFADNAWTRRRSDEEVLERPREACHETGEGGQRCLPRNRVSRLATADTR